MNALEDYKLWLVGGKGRIEKFFEKKFMGCFFYFLYLFNIFVCNYQMVHLSYIYRYLLPYCCDAGVQFGRGHYSKCILGICSLWKSSALPSSSSSFYAVYSKNRHSGSFYSKIHKFCDVSTYSYYSLVCYT